MEILETVLPIVIDILLIVLIIVGIIIGIKCIYIMDKAKEIMLNVEGKINSLNTLFSVVDIVNNKIALITDKASSLIEKLIERIFNKNEMIDDEVEIIEIEKKKGRKKNG